MDVSDGLTASLQQLNRITGCGFVIDASKLPIDDGVSSIANEIGADPIHVACSASVDFELLFSAPLGAVEEILEIGRKANLRISHIGQTTEASEIRMRKSDGEFYETFPGIPWDHQVSDITTVFKREPRF